MVIKTVLQHSSLIFLADWFLFISSGIDLHDHFHYHAFNKINTPDQLLLGSFTTSFMLGKDLDITTNVHTDNDKKIINIDNDKQ